MVLCKVENVVNGYCGIGSRQTANFVWLCFVGTFN